MKTLLLISDHSNVTKTGKSKMAAVKIIKNITYVHMLDVSLFIILCRKPRQIFYWWIYNYTCIYTGYVFFFWLQSE